MALELVLRNTDFYAYRSCADSWVPFPPGATTGYHGYCGTGQQYFETITMLDSFVYDAAADRYRFITWNNMANWPSWVIMSSVIHPETGVEESRETLVGYAVAHAWTEPMYNAGLNKVVAGYLVTPGGYGIVDVLLPDGIPTATHVANPYVTATQIPILAGSNQGYALDPASKMIAISTLMGGSRIAVYDYSPYPSAATYKWDQQLPESFTWSVGYESSENMWLLCSGSVFNTSDDGRQTLLKYNYARNKMELLSELQTAGGADRMAKVAWDTKRKKLGAVRIKADGVDGKHNNAFEIYAPRIAATRITVPVNLKPISDEGVIPFVSHVLGSKGEAGASRSIAASCSPTAALVITPNMTTEANGRVQVTLKPHVAGATETLTITHTDNKVLT